MGSPRVAPEILRILNANAGQVVSLDVIAAATGLDEMQIQKAVHRMISVNKIPIKVVMRGRAWQLESGKAEKTTPLPSPRAMVGNIPAWIAERRDQGAAPAPAQKVGRVASNPRRHQADDVYISIGTDKDGNVLVRNSASGKVFVAREL